MLVENSSYLRLNSELIKVKPLKLNMLHNSDYSDYKQISLLSDSQGMTQRGVSSIESLEYQDKITTPVIVSDSDSDTERARIIEEATKVAEKLMNSQLSKISYESELRTIETRYPTRVNSPRYYNEKKEVMNRANKLLNNEYSLSFLQNKLKLFNYVENIFSTCNCDELVEQIQNDKKTELNPFVSPKKRNNANNMKIFEDLKINNEEKNIKLAEERKYSNKGSLNKVIQDDKVNLETIKKSTSKKQLDFNLVSDNKLDLKSNSNLNKKETKLKDLNNKSLNKKKLGKEKNKDYMVDNDVFCLEDGSGYITFNVSNIVEENKCVHQTGKKTSKNKEKNSPTSKNYNEAQRMKSTIAGNYQIVNNSTKECKKKLRQNNAECKKITQEPSLNYSSNCIRGRMDYISTDVFV